MGDAGGGLAERGAELERRRSLKQPLERRHQKREEHLEDHRPQRHLDQILEPTRDAADAGKQGERHREHAQHEHQPERQREEDVDHHELHDDHPDVEKHRPHPEQEAQAQPGEERREAGVGLLDDVLVGRPSEAACRSATNSWADTCSAMPPNKSPMKPIDCTTSTARPTRTTGVTKSAVPRVRNR